MAFDDKTIQNVWEKATKVEGFDPDMFRKDPCGAWIVFNKYGLRDNPYGWEIDHVYPVVMGGDDDLRNLRAMHWRNNASKGDDYPSYIARITSEDNRNKDCYNSHTVNTFLREFIKQKYNG